MTDNVKVLDIVEKMAVAIDENAQFLTDLDAAIGDNDHGINMDRGFKKVIADLPGLEGKGVDAIMKKVGMDLVSTVGGSAGPLYGTAFMKAGASVAGKTEVDMADFLNMMEAAIGGVQLRGKAVKGEKTMLDAMIPALDAMKEANEAGKGTKEVLEAGVKAAEDGVEYTKTIIATKGRASYLGERSIGHQDPGATSFTVILKTIAAEY
ncbi:MAG: dihydroxyacetone kinase subunit L [Lachnospiraceae bacterium]|nr:dihydroxyacetone kinase subunit L [Lachnospiraceae bacterium]